MSTLGGKQGDHEYPIDSFSPPEPPIGFLKCRRGQGEIQQSMIEDPSDPYRILELGPGATLEEVKRSYRELVRVWHPDRFHNDPKLQKRGEEKLKQINSAYERICNGGATQPRSSPRPAEACAPNPDRTAHTSSGAGHAGSRNGPPRKEPGPQQPPPAQQRTSPSFAPRRFPSSRQDWGRRYGYVLIVVIIYLVGKAIFSTEDRSRRTASDYSTTQTQPSQSQPDPDYQPPKSDIVQSQSSSARLVPPPIPAPPSAPAKPSQVLQSPDADILQPQPMPKIPVARQSVPGPNTRIIGSATKATTVPSAPVQSKGYFTVGSTRDEVLEVQGAPTKFTDTSLTYGLSIVSFANGRVSSWNIYASSPLKAQLLPSAPVQSKGYFTVGSTKDEVLEVQGTPTKFTDTSLTYGLSNVSFANGRVSSWNIYASSPVKAQLLPSAPVQSKGYFTVGSTKDEVLEVQGTPTKFTDTSLTYGLSNVNFTNGRVSSWNIYASSPLNVR